MVMPSFFIFVLLLALATVLLVLFTLRSLRTICSRIETRLESLNKEQERIDRTLREETGQMREEISWNGKQVREELTSAVRSFADSILKRISEAGTAQKNQLDIFSTQLTTLTTHNVQRLDKINETTEDRSKQMQGEISNKLELIRADSNANLKLVRDETHNALNLLSEALLKRMMEIGTMQKNNLDIFSDHLKTLTQTNEQKLDKLRETIEKQLRSLQDDNNNKLEQMRATVDEKLHSTLEKRLGESFKIVSERLELVHKGLGEMHSLACGVGDLKKVLTNVKTRGTFGEIQLNNLLEQILTKEQYETNIVTKKGSSDRVEFAIKLPGRDGTVGGAVWLPIDAKFPQEDYLRLIEAQEQSNPILVEESSKQLERTFKEMARSIKDKYLDPPYTTDFGIMFLPTEGLYAEILRRTGLVELLQRDYRVVITGPTTLAALLNSLQMGFRTLTIEKRSSEVWILLGAVKTEFSNFGTILEKTQKKLQEASTSIETAAKRSRAIERKLRNVQDVPSTETAGLLPEVEDNEH